MMQMFQKLIAFVARPRVLRTAAYVIPLIGLAVVLYLNYLPFGYDKTFTIAVGSLTDETGEFHISPYGAGLSDPMVTASGTPYRILSGSAYATFAPNAYLRDATATVTIDTPGVTIIPPNISFDPNARSWDYTLPKDPANAGCIPFNGATQKDLPNTSTLFTDPDQAFSVYASWTPESGKDGFQQIVGYHSWELLQNKEDVKFQIGTTTIKYVFNADEFYGKTHTALAVYMPSNLQRPYGYIELFVDGNFAGRVYFPHSANLVPETAHDLTLGKSNYDEASYYIGCVNDVRIVKDGIDAATNHASFTITRDRNTYPITLLSIGQAVTLKNITLHVVQK